MRRKPLRRFYLGSTDPLRGPRQRLVETDKRVALAGARRQMKRIGEVEPAGDPVERLPRKQFACLSSGGGYTLQASPMPPAQLFARCRHLSFFRIEVTTPVGNVWHGIPRLLLGLSAGEQGCSIGTAGLLLSATSSAKLESTSFKPKSFDGFGMCQKAVVGQ